MYSTNPSYDPDSNDGVASNEPYLSPPGSLRRMDGQSFYTPENSPRVISDKMHGTIDLVEKKSWDDDSYYSLKRFRDRRRGKRDEDSGLSRRVKRFYEDQDELIDIYARVHNRAQGNEDENTNEEKQIHERTQRMSSILTKVSFGVNIVCRRFSIDRE